MAFKHTDPLLFELPDGQCHVMTTEYFMNLMNEFLGSITADVTANVESLTAIDSRIDYWLEQQQPDQTP